jgi:hypothetical protein
VIGREYVVAAGMTAVQFSRAGEFALDQEFAAEETRALLHLHVAVRQACTQQLVELRGKVTDPNLEERATQFLEGCSARGPQVESSRVAEQEDEVSKILIVSLTDLRQNLGLSLCTELDSLF